MKRCQVSWAGVFTTNWRQETLPRLFGWLMTWVMPTCSLEPVVRRFLLLTTRLIESFSKQLTGRMVMAILFVAMTNCLWRRRRCSSLPPCSTMLMSWKCCRIQPAAVLWQCVVQQRIRLPTQFVDGTITNFLSIRTKAKSMLMETAQATSASGTSIQLWVIRAFTWPSMPLLRWCLPSLKTRWRWRISPTTTLASSLIIKNLGLTVPRVVSVPMCMVPRSWSKTWPAWTVTSIFWTLFW